MPPSPFIDVPPPLNTHKDRHKVVKKVDIKVKKKLNKTYLYEMTTFVYNDVIKCCISRNTTFWNVFHVVSSSFMSSVESVFDIKVYKKVHINVNVKVKIKVYIKAREKWSLYFWISASNLPRKWALLCLGLCIVTEQWLGCLAPLWQPSFATPCVQPITSELPITDYRQWKVRFANCLLTNQNHGLSQVQADYGGENALI